jgi:hypothetical protein
MGGTRITEPSASMPDLFATDRGPQEVPSHSHGPNWAGANRTGARASTLRRWIHPVEKLGPRLPREMGCYPRGNRFAVALLRLSYTTTSWPAASRERTAVAPMTRSSSGQDLRFYRPTISYSLAMEDIAQTSKGRPRPSQRRRSAPFSLLPGSNS